MKKAHIGLLPSKCETYGYAVLEYQACGCPCVTTDIRVLGEINNDQCGWVCHIPHNAFGEAIYGCSSKETKVEVSEALKKEPERVFSEVLDNPKEISTKGRLSLTRIRTEHSPAVYAKRLAKIYNRK